MHDQSIIDGFASRLRQARLARRLSQRALARRAGISQDVLSHYEMGQRTPRLTTLRRLASALEVDVNYFMGTRSSRDPQIDAALAQASLLPLEVQRHLIRLIERLSATAPAGQARAALEALEELGSFEPLELLVGYSALVLLSLELEGCDYWLVRGISEQGRRLVNVVTWHVAGRRVVQS